MFHVMLALPALMTFGAMALFILTAPFCIGGFLQLILTIIGEKVWVMCVPAGLGVLGLIGSLIGLLGDIPLVGILIYWGIYFLCIWVIWLVVTQIKKYIRKKLTH